MNNSHALQSPVVAIHWPRFGPYHLARMRAATRLLGNAGVEVVGLEIASRDNVYSWKEEAAHDTVKRVVFPGRAYEEIARGEMWRGISATLSKMRCDAIAINGYSSPDACSILLWRRLHGLPAILMTESKADDAPRQWWKEWIKGRIVAQFSSALCGGQPQRRYLEQLGMDGGQIFEGYDAVDNDYFRLAAEQARRDPAAQQSLPGLEEATPFFLASARFVKRKNLDGLLLAYGQYRRLRQQTENGHRPWRLVVLGDGIERQRLENLVQSEGIAGVSFPGFRQIAELPIYYGLAGAFIHAPHQEQWGLVVNEAMAAGLPVLVSRTCGCASDLVCEGVNGFTFAPGDTAGLAQLMERMSHGGPDVDAMGAVARDRIQSWGPERFADGLWGAVQVALSHAPASGIVPAHGEIA